MKIYTRTGDDGSTGLFGGPRVPKSHPRLAAYGTLDELSAHLGHAIAADASNEVARLYEPVQNELFTLGSHLATPADSPHAAKLPAISSDWTTRLEREIDAADTRLPPLQTFILPGGTELAARLHLARTVCRRAEREIVALTDAFPASLLEYLNRLSDHLFTHARLANHLQHTRDIPWVKPGQTRP